MSTETSIRISRGQDFLLNENALIQLQNNDPALTTLTIGIYLDIYDRSRSDGFLPHENDWGKLGQFIGRNTHLTELKFYQFHFIIPTLKQFKDFCSGLANNTSVKKVDFLHAPIILGEGRDVTDGYGYMSNWFENNVVEEIIMPRCYIEDGNYDNSGEISKMAIILAKFSSLKVFQIEFDDDYFRGNSPCEVSAEIFDALCHHSNLENVQITHTDNTKWSRWGYSALARLLSGSKIKKLGLRDGKMNDEGAFAVSAALIGNDTLKEIALNDYDDLEITSAGWKAFEKLLSDPSSIMDTYNSNHTLQKLFRDCRFSQGNWQRETLGDDLYLLLRVNTLCNKSDAARVKIIMRHLTGDFRMEPFLSMDLPVLPFALAFMGRMNANLASLYKFAEADLGLMFKFVRGVAPALFDTSPLAGNKRKVQKM